jgi:hypothetical protein
LGDLVDGKFPIFLDLNRLNRLRLQFSLVCAIRTCEVITSVLNLATVSTMRVILHLFKGALSNIYVVSCRIIGYVNYELERMWEKVTVAYFTLPYQHLQRQAEKSHCEPKDNRPSGRLLSGPTAARNDQPRTSSSFSLALVPSATRVDSAFS